MIYETTTFRIFDAASANVRDAQAWLARRRAMPVAVDGLIARLVADTGPPLDVLTQRIQAWIEGERNPRRRPRRFTLPVRP